MAKDPPSKRPVSTGGGSSRAGKSGSSSNAGRGGRTRKAPPPVTAKPRPWGLIAAAVVIVLFAATAIGYAVVQVNQKQAAADPANIQGLVSKSFPSAQHSQGPVTYQDSPPFGGDHDPEWADCTGTVYTTAIRNENAVHPLEHGAVWITYSPDLPADQVATLAKLVDGQGFIFMSPYPGLKSKVSLQAWGSQLFVDSVTDPRIQRFITALKQGPKTPEQGASCDNPSFLQSPRTPDPTPPPTGPGSTDAPVTTAP